MKKTILTGIYFISVFFIALLGTSAVMNSGNTDMTMEMADATLPVVTMQIGEYQVDRLYGYLENMDTRYMRDTVFPIGGDRSVSFSIDTYENTIEDIEFEVRSINGERLVENTKIENYTYVNDRIQCHITLKDLINAGEEYMLVILVQPSEGDTIRYYTRIVQSEELYIQEKLEYVTDFNNRTFDKEKAAELTKYLESNSEGDNSTFSRVTIHSSFKQVTWGDLQVERVTEPVIDIKEIEEGTGSFLLEYMVITRSGKEKTYYKIKEYYRIRYTPERMYLLDFERNMTQIFDESALENDKIVLGIVDKNVEMKESDGGNVIAFVSSGKLYGYNVTDQKLARIFTFHYEEDDITDVRSGYDRHNIKILNVDETGNVEFIVYGYMNRGRHEGHVGVSAYFYNSMTNTVEEQVYIPYDRSFELLDNDIKNLTYANSSGKYYLMMKGTVYAIDLESREYSVVVSGLGEDDYRVSKSNKMLVWQDGGDKYSCRELKLLNLGSGRETAISAGNGEFISLIGFMEEDLIYGLARQRDIVNDYSDKVIFPMYCLKIQSDNGKLLKTYQENDIYVVDSSITDNQLTLSRVVRDNESGEYTPTTDDQIMSTEKENDKVNNIITVVTEAYESVVEIDVKDEINTGLLKKLTPKEVIFEGERKIVLNYNEDNKKQYYVYGKNGIDGIFTDAGDAVIYAYDNAGVVVDDDGAYIWKRSARSTRNQIMAITGEEVSENRTSLSVCLDTILRFEGVSRRTEYLLEQGNTVTSILEASLKDVQVLNLNGCSLDTVLYYVNQDIPVLAMLQDGNAVLIVGFNELNIVVMNPLTGEVYKKGMNDSTQWFEENGNNFITYVRKKQD